MIQQTAGPVNPLERKNQGNVFQTSLEAAQGNISGANTPSIQGVANIAREARQNLGVPVSEAEWNLISESAISSENPQEELQRYAAAITFAREYDMPISTAMQNLDSLTEYQLGKKFSPDKTAAQAIADSFRVGKLTVERSEVAADFRRKHYAGEDVTELAARIAEIDADIEANQDKLPRNIATRLLKLGAQILPYTIDLTVEGVKGGIATAASVAGIALAAGVPLAATGVGAAPALGAAAVGTGAAFAVGQAAFMAQRGRELQSGVAYYDMVNAGVDKDTAFLISDLEGAIYGIVESFLNQIGGVFLNATGVGTIASKTASAVMGKLTANGTLGTAGKVVSRYILEGAGEGLEEFTQSLTTSAREAITRELTGVVPEDSRGALTKAVEEGVTGFIGGLLLGLPVSAANVAIDVRQAKQINEFAKQVPSKQTFINSMEKQKPENMETTDWNEAMSKTWDRNNSNRTPSVIADEETAINELDAGKGRTPSGVVRRLQDGSLYTNERDNVLVGTDGIERHRMNVGDPVTGTRYGYVEYDLTGNTVTIEDVKVKEGYEGIRKEAILSLTRQYEGYDIQWEAKGENLEAIRKQLIEENPRGPEAGLQYYDGITDVSQRMKISQTIREYFPRMNASEISLASTIMQLRAEAKGLSVENYIAQYSKDGRMFGSGLLDDVSIKNIKGTTAFDSMEKGVKAIIYAGQKADFSTFTHEAFHVFRREMEQTKQLEEALSEAAANGELAKYIQAHGDIFQGSVFAGRSAQQIAEAVSGFGETWTALQEEISARLWEAYLLGGQTQSAKLKNIFRRIAEWMRKIYDAIRNQVQLNQKIVEVFDSLLDKDTPLARAARKDAAATKETSSQATQNTGEEQLYQQAPPTDSEAFREWFGDSKVVDENGDPLVVYHGSRQWFDAFNDGTEKKHSKAPKGSIFATSSRKVAGSYYDYWGGTDPDVILEKDSPLHQNYSWGTYRKGGVYSLYMKIENPLIIDFEGKLWDEGDYDINEITKRAKSEGYDGVIAKNIRDIGFNDIPRDEYGNYQDTIATDYIAFNSTQVKATNNLGTWDAGNPNILYQEAVEKIENGSLAVLHNISASRLASIEDIGGMPSPSLAITKPNIPFTQFGEITLIANPSVAIKALEEERIYDRDVWSPTVPMAEWKINQKVIDKFDKKIMPIIYEETGNYFSGSDAFSKSDIARGPYSLIDSYKKELGAKIAFLKDRGIEYELKFKKPKPPLTFPMEVIEGNLEYFRSTKFETENSDTVREYLRPKINEYLEKSLAHRKEKNPALYETMKSDLLESYLRFGVLDRVFNFAKTYDKDALVFDEYETADGIRQTIKDNDEQFSAWIEENIKEAYTDPKIKIGSKKYDYTAENILKWMRSQSERASQDTMTYGPNKAASNAGTTFWNRKGIREFEDTLISREEQQAIWNEKIEPLTELVQRDLPDYNNRYSTWESLDAIYQAIGNYITKYGSTVNIPLMRKELSAKYFTKVPKEIIERAAILAQRLATLPQDYFEAKPNRVVSLDEFVSAVVPNNITDEQRSILDKHDISVYEYEDDIDRQSIIEELYASQSSQILFQETVEANAMILAREADSWESFKESYIIDVGMDFDAFVPDDDQWYIDVFNQAHDIPENVTLEQEPETVRVRMESEQQKDDYFNDLMGDDEELQKFVKEMGIVLVDRSFERDGVGDAEEAAERDRMIDLRFRIEHEVTPFILANAIRSTTSKKLSPTAIKSMRTMMGGDRTRFYRDLYAETMQDEDLKPAVIDTRLPSIEDAGYEDIETMSITDRLRLADNIEAENLKRMILKGDELFAGEAEKVINKMDRDIADLNNKISELENDIKARATSMNKQERELSTLYEKISDARSELERETKQIKKKSDADPKYQVDMTNTYSLQSQIEKLHEQIKKLRVSDKVKATVKRQEALANLKQQLRKKQQEKDAARKVREYKIKLARRIMVKPSDAVDYEYRQKIYQIQAMLDPKFRRDSVVVEGERMDLEDAKNLFEGSTDEELIEALGERAFNRIMGIKKPLNDWTINELEGVAEAVANLRSEGRQIWEAKEEHKRIIAENYRIAMMRTLLASGKYQSRPIAGSFEDIRKKRSAREKVRSIKYAFWDAAVWAQIIDGDKKGEAFDLLVRTRRKLQAMEWDNIEKRSKPVIDLMKSKEVNLDPDDLYQRVPISLTGGREAQVSYSYLMYAYLSQFNEQNRAAVAYGVLVSNDEKRDLDHDNKLIQNLGDTRYEELLALADRYLDTDNPDSPYMKVVEAIRQDLNSQAGRINDVAIREYNQPMRTLENYLPNHRLGLDGEDLATSIMDDMFNMNAGSMPTGVARGFTQNRVNISPNHQSEINMDLFGVWDKSMRQHEHMIAFAEYGRMLNRVFKVKTDGAKDLRTFIAQTHGQSLMDNIDNYINEIMNPDSFNRLEAGDKFLRAMRGNLGAAYLAWKFSGLVLQAITSPMTFFADVKVQNLFGAFRDMSLRPIKTWNFIAERSQMMKNRSMNPVIQLILDRANEQTSSKLSKFNKQQQEIGSMGLTLVDRYAVAGGWLGAYRQKYNELINQVEGMSEEQIEQAASQWADEVILRTQPTGDRLELSPFFKMGGEAMKIITQFQTSLNVIYKNLTYDIPSMVKRHEYGRAIGQVVGYVMAGALLGAVAEGYDDDDDTIKEKLLKWIYWSTTQFAESTPVFGTEMDSVVRSLITGEKPRYFGTSLFPAAESFFKGAVNITQQEWEKAVKNLGYGFGYFTGLPVSGTKQIERVFDEGPGAFLGRRD